MCLALAVLLTVAARPEVLKRFRETGAANRLLTRAARCSRP
jgi:hypothetical protein